jgi:ectoine hydroxylase-related dioxygenase (phytanoyl-CoA dioxygenase family)
MTTYPQGYLIANWIAFEDITPDSGPLEFYPGSHRLPYSYSRECGIALDEGRGGYGAYHAKYETHVQRQIAEHNLTPHYFNARKGDVLFWHANLLHGGSLIQNQQRSRRALVCHYFAEGCVCYHDYTGSPSHLTEFPFLERRQFDAQDYLRLNPDVAAAGVDPYKHYVEFGFKEKRRVR